MIGLVARYYRDRLGRVYERVSPGRYRLCVGTIPRGVRAILPHEVMLLLKDSGLYMRTHEAVPAVACPYPRCKSKAGEPCVGPFGHKSTTHTVRREAYTLHKRGTRT